ncbi:MAG TPA: carboxypeptidase-like regulatory domain-containing protein [Pyrinomonadaceae bacterium]|nr:carboxypeptidase-like regulatory domain-containing protein [Pyrinomonadaceae bacterium]
MDGLLRLVLTLILIFGGAAWASAQDTVTGAFEGIVSDSQTGAPLKGATVEIVNQASGLGHQLNTDYRGRFYQGLLIPGIYVVRVSLTGYQTREVLQRLRITYAGEVVPIPVALDPALVLPPAGATPTPPLTAEDIDIRASITRIDGRRSGSFGEEEVTMLPLGGVTITRTFDELALLLPGVAPPPQTLGSVAGPGVGAGVGSAGQFSVNGLRSRGNNFTVDGSDNNDEDIGVRRQGFIALIPQSLESIQEYQVITLLAPASFGRNIGAQVNAVSKSGGSKFHGTFYGTFNSSQLNARNFFDTTFGNATSPVRANNQDVLVQTRNTVTGGIISQQPLTTTNESGGKDSFTFLQPGFVLGGPIRRDSTFYFVSFEQQIINAAQENSFAVPSTEQRGAFGTGASGIFQNPFTGEATAAIPAGRGGSAIFSLFPLPNNPNGIYGGNTFTQVLPANGRGTMFSGKIDENLKFLGKEHSLTGRYNFTNDWRSIPVTGGAIFSTVKPVSQTQNFSLFINSKISSPLAMKPVFNQIRLSYGRTQLRFDEIRDKRFLIPSNSFPAIPFLLNAPSLLNVTAPTQPGIANSGPVILVRQPITVEQELGPLGQVNIAGFNPLGVDVLNFPQARVNNTYQVADQLTMRSGNHSYAFGTDIRRSELNSDLPRNARPLVTFNGAPRLIFENGEFRVPTAGDPNQFISGADLAALGAASNFYLTLNTVGNDAKISLRFYQLNFYGQDEWRIRPNLTISYGLRYEYNTPVRELNRRIENTFDDQRLNFAPGLRSIIDGRKSIYDPDRNNFAPRVGLAFSPALFGPNKLTVVKIGYGLYYDQILGAVVSQSRNVFPTFLSLNFGGLNASSDQTTLTFFNPGRTIVGTGDGRFVPIARPGTLNQLNPDLPLTRLFELINRSFPSALSATLPTRQLQMPTAQHYSVTIEQQLGANMVVSAAYVGSRGQHLLRFTTPNLGPAATLVPNSFSVFQEEFGIPTFQGRVLPPARPVSGVGGINLFETTANSNYDSLQLQIRARLGGNFQYRAAYTLSNATDDVSDVFELAGASALPQNSVNFKGELGFANFDIRHRFTTYFNYDFAARPTSHWNFILAGLRVATIGTFTSGQPFTVNSLFDVNLDGNLTDRLNSVAGLVRTGNDGQPLKLISPPANLLAPIGQDGAVGRNTFRAGRIFTLDSSVAKSWRMASGKSFTVRTDIFNLTNRANFGIPNRFLEAPGFGKATSTITPGRRVQFSLKYSF